MPKKFPKDMLTTAQLMRRWECSRRLIDYWCETKQIKFKKVGKYRLFKIEEIEKFEDSRNGVI